MPWWQVLPGISCSQNRKAVVRVAANRAWLGKARLQTDVKLTQRSGEGAPCREGFEPKHSAHDAVDELKERLSAARHSVEQPAVDVLLAADCVDVAGGSARALEQAQCLSLIHI